MSFIALFPWTGCSLRSYIASSCHLYLVSFSLDLFSFSCNVTDVFKEYKPKQH